MSKRNNRQIDDVRRKQSAVGNHVIDEYLAGRLSRRAFIRRGTIVGLSIPTIGALIAACGSDDETTGTGAPGTALPPTPVAAPIQQAAPTPVPPSPSQVAR